jgi:glycosyltransferase involved in cell wall biosynthesis
MNDTATPLVSVVIPTYNHARYLGRALQSVLDQTYVNWEAIIIDNNSTDNTDEVMASFANTRITYLKIHNNGVIAVSRNAGIQAAKGDWISFLDSDDWWTADKLQACVDCIHDKVDLVYHDMKVVADQPRLFRRKIIKSWQVKTPVLLDLLLKGNAIANSSVVVRKRLLEKIGGINESVEMIAAEDYNTWLRIAQLTDQLVYLPRRLGYYLNHSQGVSQKDTSHAYKSAILDFTGALNDVQRKIIASNIAYMSGRYHFLNREYDSSFATLRNSLDGARGRIFLRVIFILMLIFFKKLPSRLLCKKNSL